MNYVKKSFWVSKIRTAERYRVKKKGMKYSPKMLKFLVKECNSSSSTLIGRDAELSPLTNQCSMELSIMK